MIDPLKKFNWQTLHSRYDDEPGCARFLANPAHRKYLRALKPIPKSDRELYYQLIKTIGSKNDSRGIIKLATYEAILYWKLYSQPAVIAKVLVPLSDDKDLRRRTSDSLAKLMGSLPLNVSRNSNVILSLVKKVGDFNVWGMASPTALPARTTVLHYLYPNTVPILDKMVLQAVGVKQDDANNPSKRVKLLESYLPHAWNLADSYSNNFKKFPNETPVRLVDMALWIERSKRTRRR